MKNVYLIFLDEKDVYSNVTVTCTREELNDKLIEIELIDDPNEHYNQFSWIIFENGVMIKG